MQTNQELTFEMQRSKPDWSCVFLQMVLCFSLSVPVGTNCWIPLEEQGWKGLVPGRYCARQKTNILALFSAVKTGALCFCNCVSMSGQPVEIWLYRACQRYPCTPGKSNTIDDQSANVFFPPNAGSSTEKCKKWQWSENFTETSGMKKPPRKGLYTDRAIVENLPFFILAVTSFSVRAAGQFS